MLPQDWLDVSGDGIVSVDELLVALSALSNDGTSREEAEALVVEALGESKKGVNWTDFCAIIEKGLTQNATAAQMFELLDPSGVGQLSPEAIRAAMKKYGCDASDGAIDKMIRYVDVDRDGQVCATLHQVVRSVERPSPPAITHTPPPRAPQVSLQEFADALAKKGEVQEGERRA